MTERIGFLLLPRFGLTSLACAVDALLAANEMLERRAFEPVMLTLDGQSAAGETGPMIAVAHSLDRAPTLSALFIVTDSVPRQASDAGLVAGAARAIAARNGVLGGIGVGAAWLADAGLMRGFRCTLHWAHTAALAERHTDVVVSSNLYEIDRTRLTCGGGACSLDMMIAWLGARFGERLVHQLITHFGLERVRARDERQLAPVGARVGGSAKLVEAVALMESNIGEPLTTEDIARLVGVSRRQLERLFRQHLDALPSRWYLELRLERARKLLQETSQSILQVGLSCGFASAPHFSNAYRNHFGRTPRDERSQRAAEWRSAARARPPGDLKESQ